MSPAFIAMTMTSFDADKVAMTAQLFRQISQLQLLYMYIKYLSASKCNYFVFIFSMWFFIWANKAFSINYKNVWKYLSCYVLICVYLNNK